MAEPNGYNWNRLWYPLDARLPVEDGYLSPEEEGRGASLLDLAAIPCLVLLGAPGMGKSHEATKARTELQARGEAVDLIEAPRRRNVAQTLQDLTRSSNADAWARDGTIWTVFVDGLDELENGAGSFDGALRNFLSFLAEKVSSLANFRLRLLCRTVEWAATLDQALASMWPAESIQVRQLAPLAAADVERASNDYLGSESDASRFLRDVKTASVEALAAKPVSWRMLVQVFRQSNALPPRQVDLFEQGVRALLESRRSVARRLDGLASVDVAMMAAGRIAAAMALAGAGAVTLSDTAAVEVEGGSIPLTKLAGGVEPIPPNSVRLQTEDLLDVVRSPLFAAISPDVYVWSHQTFMEFLAGRYLIEHELEPERLLQLLTVTDPDGGSGGIPPQLREVAGWAAALSSPVFDAVLAREPDVLLQSDVAAVDGLAKARLTAALLQRLRSGELKDTFWRLRPLLSRLSHEGLAQQLISVIKNPEDSFEARRGAVDIAEEVKLAELAPVFVDIMFDQHAPLGLRREAAGAVRLLGGETEKWRMAGLLAEGADLDDEIRGSILEATWPSSLGMEQLLEALTPPQDPSQIGIYSSFLYHFNPGAITAADARAILAWLEPHAEGAENPDSFWHRRAIARLFWAAVSVSNILEVRQALARFISTAFDRLNQSLFEDDDQKAQWPTEPEVRVALVAEILNVATDPVVAGRYLQHFSPGLIVGKDLERYLTLFRTRSMVPVRRALAEIIVSISRLIEMDDLAGIYEAAQGEPLLLEAWLAAYSVALDSPSVTWMRNAERRRAEAEGRRAREAELLGRVEADISALLTRIEAGETDLWWRLNLQLFVDDTGRYRGELEFQSDLTQSPGWKRTNAETQRRITEAAFTSLRIDRLGSPEWLTAATHHRPAAAGYRAVRLLRALRPEVFESLGSDIWRIWAPAVIAFFDNDAEAAATVQTEIVAQAYANAPGSTFCTLKRLAQRGTPDGLSGRPFEVIAAALDDRLGRALDNLRRSVRTLEPVKNQIVSLLARRKFRPLILEMGAALSARVTDTEARSVPMNDALASGVAELMEEGQVDIWADVLALTDLDPESARSIWTHLASDSALRRTPNVGSLQAALIARAYCALYTLFPQRPEPTSGARFLSAIDQIDRMRTSLLSHLTNRGTADSVEALIAIADNVADDGWAKHNLAEARRTYRANVAGADPEDVLQRIALLGPVYPERAEASLVDLSPFPEELNRPSINTDERDISEREPRPGVGRSHSKRRLSIVAVATEWGSANGGVSTLNRELCLALAADGHDVVCAVLDVSEQEKAQARADRVEIVVSPRLPALGGKERLLLFERNAFPGQTADVVFGHDQITGSAAVRVSRMLDAAYVHFLHTVPEEIEPLKARTQNQPSSMYRGYDKRQAQRELCESARLIVGIGPRIATFAPSVAVPIYQLIPGLNIDLLNRRHVRPHRPFCLIGGRMEDADLKGLPIASAVVWELGQEPSRGVRPHLIVRGLDPSGAEDEWRKTELTKDQFSHTVMARAFTPNSVEIYQDIDEASVVLMPSLAEGFGLTGFEAIAAGKPVLITLESGLAEWLMALEQNRLIDEGFTEACIATVVSTTQKAPWINKLRTLLSRQDEAFERALKLRDALKAEFTWARAAAGIADRLVEMLE